MCLLHVDLSIGEIKHSFRWFAEEFRLARVLEEPKTRRLIPTVGTANLDEGNDKTDGWDKCITLERKNGLHEYPPIAWVPQRSAQAASQRHQRVGFWHPGRSWGTWRSGSVGRWLVGISFQLMSDSMRSCLQSCDGRWSQRGHREESVKKELLLFITI